MKGIESNLKEKEKKEKVHEEEKLAKESRKVYRIDKETSLNKRENILKEPIDKMKETETIHKTTQSKNQSIRLDLEEHKSIIK